MKKNIKKKKKMSTITISDKQVFAKKGMVVLSLAEYERLVAAASISAEYIAPKAAARLERAAEKALRDYKNNKLIKISSLADLR